uniref:Heparan-alpha-glucosaminide N-acetyltransferase catalytic domain-containing protein n=1 Tax=Nitratidesulfovibrio vulgaris (strain DSM 19637 / Miyazaki F) TaxID=883 RepID=B8DK27_NITV9
MMADTAASPRRSGGRLASIDAMRGLVMLLMTLDHVRGDFTVMAQKLWHDVSVLPANPLELETTTPTFFLMRWVTHLCAPTFVFLAGASVNFWMLRHGGEHSVGRYLLTRGAMIVGINMMLGLHAPFSSARLLVLDVLWAIGCSMLLLAIVVRLPRTLSLCLALLLVAGHDALRAYMPEGEVASVLWKLAFVRSYFEIPGTGAVYALYTVLPWFGLMWLGYLCGWVFRLEAAQRRRLLPALGAGCLALFALLRLSGGYGDPTPFMAQSTAWWTMASFMNVGKYPPSLQFSLLTLGAMWLLLAWFEHGRRLDFLCVPGRAPLAYYVLHIICIRALAAVLALMPEPVRSASFSASGVVVFSALVFVALYPVCAWIGLWLTGGYRMSGGAPA